MKSKYMKKILFLITCIMTLSLMSCQVMSRFNSKDINTFLDDFSDKYDIVEDTKVQQSHGDIFIQIHFTSEVGVELDESMYSDIRDFFMQKDVQERIQKKMNSSPDSYTYYPSISIVFTDSNAIETHDIETNGEMFKEGPNNYKEWSKPYFSNKGRFTTEARASSDVMKERSKMYDAIKETIFENNKHNAVSITYNFGSLKDEHVVLRVSFNSNDEDYDELTKVWYDKYNTTTNLVVDTLDLYYYLSGKTVAFEEKYSSGDKNVFRSREEIEEGLIVSTYYLFDKNLLESDIQLIDNKAYWLLFNTEETNELTSYTLEEIE